MTEVGAIRLAPRRWPSYPNYGEAGPAWLGCAPESWSVTRLKHSCQGFVAGGTPDSDNSAFWADGADGTPWVAIGDLTRGSRVARTERTLTAAGLAARKLAVLPAGTILYSMYASLGKVATLDVPAATNQAILGVIPDSRMLQAPFLRWWLESLEPHVRQFSSSNTQDNLNAETVRNMPLYLPSRSEQRAIAHFLDRETGKIDALVAKKQRLIELLQEKRTAVISDAITKGLDPDVPMKDAGVGRLGDLPRPWTASPLMRLVDPERPIMYGIVLPGPDFPGGVPIIKGGDVSPERLVLERLNRTDPEIEAKYVRSRLAGGDIVYAIRGSIGAAAVVPDALEGANLTQDTARVAPRTGVHVGWLMYALQASPIFAQLEAGAVGATIRGINIFSLKRADLPVPPQGEQVAIRQYLDLQTRRMDELVESVRGAIERLREYRSALITAAVTGQIDLGATL